MGLPRNGAQVPEMFVELKGESLYFSAHQPTIRSLEQPHTHYIIINESFQFFHSLIAFPYDLILL
jgi:hypothetical protein